MGVHKADRKEKTDEHAWVGSDPASVQARREALYLVLVQVPPRQVVSYGQLAELADLDRATRWVGGTLSQLPVDTRLLWHRVLATGGRVSLPADSPGGREQRVRLREEGVLLHNDRVDICRHGWLTAKWSGQSARYFLRNGYPMTQQSWRETLIAYKSPASLALLLLGFAAGLSTMLTLNTLSVWLREAGVTRDTISFASWLGLVYAPKWAWSPMLDQWRLPFVGRLGRRRSWLVFPQVLIALGLLSMALCNPQSHLPWLIGLALLVAFAPATQDTAIDAYRLGIAEDSRQAALAAYCMIGYCTTTLLASAGALILIEWFGSTGLNCSQSAWGLTYVLFALLILPGLVTSLLIRGPAVDVPIHVNPSRFDFNYQLLSVLLLLTLLISLPAMITVLLDRIWPCASLYALLMGICPSPWGRQQIRPVRELLAIVRRPLLVAARGKKVSLFDFIHQAISVTMLIILLITVTAIYRAYYSGTWPRGTLFLLIAASCLSVSGRLLMAPVLTPITGFVQRYRWQVLLLLGLISTYRLSDTVMGVVAGVLYIDMGFSKEVIASVNKVFGILMTLIGAAAGGVLIARFSILSILFIGGAASAATNLLFAMLAQLGPLYAGALPSHDVISLMMALEPYVLMLVMTITLDNLSDGLAASAFVAYLSSLANLKFSATQYAMLSSAMLLLSRFIGGYFGTMVEGLGYEHFFCVTAVTGVPTLLPIGWLWLRHAPSSETPAPGHQNAEQH